MLMKTLFIVYTKEEEAIGWARNLIEAIGVKEHMARTRDNGHDNELYIKRYNEDDEE
mgnify:FL=1